MHIIERHAFVNSHAPLRRRRRVLSRGEARPARGSALRLRRRAKSFALISLAILALLALAAGG